MQLQPDGYEILMIVITRIIVSGTDINFSMLKIDDPIFFFASHISDLKYESSNQIKLFYLIQ